MSRSAGGGPPDQQADEHGPDRSRLGAVTLFLVAAGGTLGSGWLSTGYQLDQAVRGWGILSLLVGGFLFLVVSAVMVELSSQQAKTGGLIWLPSKSSGSLMTIVLSAGLWVFYVVNPASEATEMVRGLQKFGLHGAGIPVAAGCIVVIYAVNLLGFGFFIRLTTVLTVFKIAVPVGVIVLLLFAVLGPHPAAHALPAAHLVSASQGSGGGAGPPIGAALTAVAGSGGVIYAYLGFQGPLYFAGHVRQDGIGEAGRLRRAVIGTVAGSMALYIALQLALIWSRQHLGSVGSTDPDPFSPLIRQVLPGAPGRVATGVINLDMVLSPAGAAIVFTHMLIREVSALGRARLTHYRLATGSGVLTFEPRGLLTRVLGRSQVDVYWLILAVNCVISIVALLAAAGGQGALGNITGVMSLVVYASPAMVLVAFDTAVDSAGKRCVTLDLRWQILARVAFAGIGVVFFLAGWEYLWEPLVALLIACAALFVLPVLSGGRGWYIATSHATALLRVRRDVSAQAAVIWLGYFALLWFLSFAADSSGRFEVALVVAVISLVVFEWLVRLSRRYMEEFPPTNMPGSSPSAEQAAPLRT